MLPGVSEDSVKRWGARMPITSLTSSLTPALFTDFPFCSTVCLFATESHSLQVAQIVWWTVVQWQATRKMHTDSRICCICIIIRITLGLPDITLHDVLQLAGFVMMNSPSKPLINGLMHIQKCIA